MLPHFTRPRHSRALCRACYLNTLYGYFWADDARWHADMPHRCKHCWHVGIAHLLLPHIIFINSATPCMCNKLRAAYAAWRLSLLPRNALFSTHDWCFRKHPSMCCVLHVAHLESMRKAIAKFRFTTLHYSAIQCLQRLRDALLRASTASLWHVCCMFVAYLCSCLIYPTINVQI